MSPPQRPREPRADAEPGREEPERKRKHKKSGSGSGSGLLAPGEHEVKVKLEPGVEAPAPKQKQPKPKRKTEAENGDAQEAEAPAPARKKKARPAADAPVVPPEAIKIVPELADMSFVRHLLRAPTPKLLNAHLQYEDIVTLDRSTLPRANTAWRELSADQREAFGKAKKAGFWHWKELCPELYRAQKKPTTPGAPRPARDPRLAAGKSALLALQKLEDVLREHGALETLPSAAVEELRAFAKQLVEAHRRKRASKRADTGAEENKENGGGGEGDANKRKDKRKPKAAATQAAASSSSSTAKVARFLDDAEPARKKKHGDDDADGDASVGSEGGGNVWNKYLEVDGDGDDDDAKVKDPLDDDDDDEADDDDDDDDMGGFYEDDDDDDDDAGA
jgi:hypothetical protein